MIPWGMFHPDASAINGATVLEAKNCIPGVACFQPLPTLVASTSALPAACRGAVSILKDDGSVATFAGTQTALSKLSSTASWTAVTRVTGGAYSVGTGEQWKFELYGNNLIAAGINHKLQSIDITTGTNFADIAAAPQARYVAVVREFVLAGALIGNEKRVQWSANGNSAAWTPSVNESDYQDIPDGGPVRGLIGGEVGYVFQANKVTRMTYVAGSSIIMQFDQIEGANGLAAPHSLVRLRSQAFYLANDGFRMMDLSSGGSKAIGTGKWIKWFLVDIKAGTELTVIGAANPVRPQIVWAYVSRASGTTTPNRLLIYDWSLDEATFADVTVENIVKWLSPGVTLDSMNSYGTMETLPFSLDSAFWKGGASLLGMFGTDHKLALQSGQPMEASFVTSDGQAPARTFVTGTRPKADAVRMTVALAARESQSDAITYGTAESKEDTGVCPAHVSGNFIRARVTVPSQTWTQIEGLDTVMLGKRGKR